MMASALVIAVGLLFPACEDEPSTGGDDLDTYFATHPYVSDPRNDSGVPPLTMIPISAIASFVGQQISFVISGGNPPYHWDVANTTYGRVDQSQDATDHAIYIANVVAPNSVIAYDSNGRSGIGEIVTGANNMQVTPLTATIPATNQPGGQIQFTVSGGIPPYQAWQVSRPDIATISASGLYRSTGIAPVGAAVEVTVSILDAAGNVAEATVTHAALQPGTVKIDQPSPFNIGVQNVVQFTASGGTPPYQWTQSRPLVGQVNPVTGIYSDIDPPVASTNDVTVIDSLGVTATIQVLEP
jgi:hypothetical protein